MNEVFLRLMIEDTSTKLRKRPHERVASDEKVEDFNTRLLPKLKWPGGDGLRVVRLERAEVEADYDLEDSSRWMATCRCEVIVAVDADALEGGFIVEGRLAPGDGRLPMLLDAVNFSVLPSPGSYSGQVVVVSSEQVPAPDADLEAVGNGPRP